MISCMHYKTMVTVTYDRYPADKGRWINVGLTLVLRLRRYTKA